MRSYLKPPKLWHSRSPELQKGLLNNPQITTMPWQLWLLGEKVSLHKREFFLDIILWNSARNVLQESSEDVVRKFKEFAFQCTFANYLAGAGCGWSIVCRIQVNNILSGWNFVFSVLYRLIRNMFKFRLHTFLYIYNKITWALISTVVQLKNVFSMWILASKATVSWHGKMAAAWLRVFYSDSDDNKWNSLFNFNS
jgi:hypothetical protein